MGGCIENLEKRRFGRLVVLRETDPWIGSASRKRRWLCRCDCGAEVAVVTGSLCRSKEPTRSCGCLQKERASAANRAGYDTRGAEYRAWSSMIRRCENPRSHDYANYGGRGISVDEAWRNDFAQFSRDMGPRPSAAHSVDRRDVNGNYGPVNCRWATRLEQANNTRANRVIEAFGRRATLSEWAREIGVRVGTLHARLDRYGMSAERALSLRRSAPSASLDLDKP